MNNIPCGIKLFDGCNETYGNWYFCIKFLLEKANVFKVLTDAPPENEATLKVFKQSDVNVRTIIVRGLADNIIPLIRKIRYENNIQRPEGLEEVGI